MRVETLTWIGEPSQPYDKKYNRWPRCTLWPFKIKGCDTIFVMDEDAYETYLAEGAIIKALDELNSSAVWLDGQDRRALLARIEDYGDRRYEAGRHDVEEEHDSI
jgi:hypothetical protein